ncbi:unnamed protein product [Mycena citricolor]|uniref:Uncharacterized protein n=1 Tax=Mycena citricolor TaxID=2018698 RepID=A0AAD2HWL4_9AGAR|nr:unnamed protein product [Mycena citricolor]
MNMAAAPRRSHRQRSELPHPHWSSPSPPYSTRPTAIAPSHLLPHYAHSTAGPEVHSHGTHAPVRFATQGDRPSHHRASAMPTSNESVSSRRPSLHFRADDESEMEALRGTLAGTSIASSQSLPPWNTPMRQRRVEDWMQDKHGRRDTHEGRDPRWSGAHREHHGARLDPTRGRQPASNDSFAVPAPARSHVNDSHHRYQQNPQQQQPHRPREHHQLMVSQAPPVVLHSHSHGRHEHQPQTHARTDEEHRGRSRSRARSHSRLRARSPAHSVRAHGRAHSHGRSLSKPREHRDRHRDRGAEQLRVTASSSNTVYHTAGQPHGNHAHHPPNLVSSHSRSLGHSMSTGGRRKHH